MRSYCTWGSVTEFLNDTSGQDLIEYALMAGFLAAAALAVMPALTTAISTTFSKVESTLAGS